MLIVASSVRLAGLTVAMRQLSRGQFAIVTPDIIVRLVI